MNNYGLKQGLKRQKSIIQHGKAMGWNTDRLEQAYQRRLVDLARHIYGNKWGVLFNTSALWVGVHYSPYNRRYCVNLLPCVTIWFTTKCGKAPKRSKM